MHAHHKDWKLSGIRRIYRNTLMAEIGQFGTGPGKLIWPTALTLTPEGDLAVKDSGNNRIQIFSREGFHKHGFSFGSKSVKCLGDIAATADGRLLVTDGSKAVKVFAKDGELIHQLKPPKMDWKSSHGLALLPCGNLAVTDWTDGGKIHIISVDWRNNAILKMNVMEGFVRPVQISVNKGRPGLTIWHMRIAAGRGQRSPMIRLSVMAMTRRGSAHRYHPYADSGAAKTNTCCPPSADRFFSLCRPTMPPTQSYSVGGQRSSGQLTGKPTGTQPVYKGRWCTVSRGHPGQPKPHPPGGAQPIVHCPLETPVHGWQ
ncbi:UNVERIFIED_CONTAM: hypothetical protein FKN15_076872 [Acipenser sinensis]